MPPDGLPSLIQERYRLTEWLGQGNMGAVYLARDERLERLVVIRFTVGRPDERGALPARWLREARTLARLSHPNLAAIYDVGEQSGWIYLVFEHIPGKGLRSLAHHPGAVGLPHIVRLPFALAGVLDVARGVLKGLAYAHQQGILHGAMRPEAIRVTPDGQVKLMDFNLAAAGDSGRLTPENEADGGLPYLAPECLAGQPADSRADLYGLGAVLYELVSGRPPFSGKTPAGLIDAILTAPLQSPLHFNPELPPAVERLILSLLARDPAMRCPSAQAALADLAGESAHLSEAFTAPAKGEATTEAALETERQHLAGLLRARVVEPLNLLLAQSGTFEQTLAGQPQARTALAVMASLARQVLQQARDLEAVLRPAALETLGLEAALELLAEQTRRGLGLTLQLEIARLPARLPAGLELAVFRLVQEVLEALPNLHVTQAGLRLAQTDDLEIELGWSGAELPERVLAGLRARGRAGGVQVEQESGPNRRVALKMKLRLRPEIGLTPRELDVLQGLVEGLSNKAIAARLTVSPRTVNFHLDHIFAKLGVNSRTEAAVMALQQGWARRPSNNTLVK